MALAQNIKALSMVMCNSKLFCNTALSTGYFVDVRPAVKPQTNCSEFTLVFCCTVQLVLLVNYCKFFPPSLPLETGLVILFAIYRY